YLGISSQRLERERDLLVYFEAYHCLRVFIVTLRGGRADLYAWELKDTCRQLGDERGRKLEDQLLVNSDKLVASQLKAQEAWERARGQASKQEKGVVATYKERGPRAWQGRGLTWLQQLCTAESFGHMLARKWSSNSLTSYKKEEIERGFRQSYHSWVDPFSGSKRYSVLRGVGVSIKGFQVGEAEVGRDRLFLDALIKGKSWGVSGSPWEFGTLAEPRLIVDSRLGIAPSSSLPRSRQIGPRISTRFGCGLAERCTMSLVHMEQCDSPPFCRGDPWGVRGVAWVGLSGWLLRSDPLALLGQAEHGPSIGRTDGKASEVGPCRFCLGVAYVAGGVGSARNIPINYVHVDPLFKRTITKVVALPVLFTSYQRFTIRVFFVNLVVLFPGELARLPQPWNVVEPCSVSPVTLLQSCRVRSLSGDENWSGAAVGAAEIDQQ
ncbi:hypothetical protein BHE74_00035275, partial [Ensete ventricosum]